MLQERERGGRKALPPDDPVWFGPSDALKLLTLIEQFWLRPELLAPAARLRISLEPYSPGFRQ